MALIKHPAFPQSPDRRQAAGAAADMPSKSRRGLRMEMVFDSLPLVNLIGRDIWTTEHGVVLTFEFDITLKRNVN